MSLDHQNATAKITIDGLVICGFNPKTRVWEVGYMRHPRHILRLDLGDDNPLDIPDDARVIRIETENGETPDYDKEFPLGFVDGGPVLDRKSDWLKLPIDERDNFRWTMNLDGGKDVPHGTITLKPPPYPVTTAYISDAVFYTASVVGPDLFLLPIEDDANAMGARAVGQHRFGKTANQIGAAIKCAAGGRIRITIDDKEFASLEHKDSQPWSITLTNMPKEDGPHGHMAGMHDGNYEKGDFQIYYDAMDVTGDKFSLWGEKPRDGAEIGRTDCNGAWVGDGLDGMTSG